MPTTSDRQPLLLDTHVWVWLEAGSDELSGEVRAMISIALGAGLLRIAAISLWELALLAARGRVVLGKPIDLWLDAALAEPGPTIEPLNVRVAIQSSSLPGDLHRDPGDLHRDPADRMIVATARVTNATLMTRDRRILDYAASGHLSAIGV
jgi:PIN domain nuclease of toxin-antitoxin system